MPRSHSSLEKVLLVLIASSMVLSGVSVQALGPNESGTTHLSSSGAYGSSYFTVNYQYQSTVSTGSNLVVSLTLHVDSITGQEAYILNYEFVVTVYVDLSHVLKAAVGEVNLANNTGQGRVLYPGAHWGPVNVTLPVSSSNTGIPTGQLKNANVSITLNFEAWIGTPYDYDLPEGAQASAGAVQINGGTNSGSNLPAYALVAGGVGIAIAVLVLSRNRKLPSENPTAT